MEMLDRYTRGLKEKRGHELGVAAKSFSTGCAGSEGAGISAVACSEELGVILERNFR